MKKVLLLMLWMLAAMTASAQERVRVGVPLFPTVSYPVLIAHEKGFFEKTA